jgi:hypothetical protein
MRRKDTVSEKEKAEEHLEDQLDLSAESQTTQLERQDLLQSQTKNPLERDLHRLHPDLRCQLLRDISPNMKRSKC